MKKLPWVIFLAAYFAAYLSVFPGDFHYDDFHSIRNNTWLVNASNIPKFFASPLYFSARPRAAMYRPLLLVTYAIDYQIYGWRAWGWHLTNLLFHLLNTLLVFALVRRTFRKDRRAWIAALLFAFSPIAGENINYLNCRSSILLTAFMLAGLLAVARIMAAREQGKSSAAWIALANLFFACGLLSKDSAAVFPALAFSYLWIFSEEPGAKKLVRAIYLVTPMAIILGGYLALRYSMFDSIFSSAELPRSRAVNAITEMKSYFWYLGLFLWPTRLSIEHDFKVEESLANLWVILSLIGLVIFLKIIIYSLSRPRSRVAAFGFLAGFYVLALLPTSSIVPLNVLVSERALYPALFALAVAFSFAIDGAWDKNRGAVLSILAAILLLYCGILIQRGRIWQNETLLWADAYSHAPLTARVVGELGRTYFARGEDEKSLRYTLKAEELEKKTPTNLFNLATIYMDMGKLEKAESYFEQGLKRDPEDVEARVNLGVVYEKLGKMELARFQLAQALEIDPGNALAHSNLGDLLNTLGETEDAEKETREALKLDPNLEMAHFNLGIMLDKQGKIQEALEHFERAYELNSGYPDNCLWVGIMNIKINRPDEAVGWVKKALALDSKYAVAWYYLGLAEKAQGKNSEALSALQNADKFVNPKDAKLKEEIAKLRAESGK